MRDGDDHPQQRREHQHPDHRGEGRREAVATLEREAVGKEPRRDSGDDTAADGDQRSLDRRDFTYRRDEQK